jgi:hypothetical protein
VDKEIRQHLAKLGDQRAIKAALFRFGPTPDADEYHFRRSARSEDLWTPVTTLSARFVAQGRSESVQDIVEVYGGQRFLLLATANGRPETAPYIVAIAAAAGAAAETLLTAMRDAADDCIDETHSRRWG